MYAYNVSAAHAVSDRPVQDRAGNSSQGFRAEVSPSSSEEPINKGSVVMRVTNESIAQLAYFYWEARGRPSVPRTRTGSGPNENYRNSN